MSDLPPPAVADAAVTPASSLAAAATVAAFAAFAAGLAAIVWVGAGYVGGKPLGLAVTTLIAAVYLAGAWELRRFQAATAALAQALSTVPDPLPDLQRWLDQLPAGLRSAVRLRIQGERVGLPGPSLTPYLAGLLVLLGMLGTFLGMVLTLTGTGLALDGAADLPAMRASLSAPVRGLGLAFGTSIAGVAASAALGFMSALARRSRLQAGQLLDSRIATTLRVHARPHQRDESLRLAQDQTRLLQDQTRLLQDQSRTLQDQARLMQEQASHMPELVARLHATMTALDRHSDTLQTRLLASQDRFHQQATVAYTALASSVGDALARGLADGARAATDAIQPVVQATMAGIAREASALHGTLGDTVQQQLHGLQTRFETSTAGTAALWQQALADHQRAGAAAAAELRDTLAQFTTQFDARSTAWVDTMAARLDGTAQQLTDTWQGALAAQQQAHDQLARGTEQALTAAAGSIQQHGLALVHDVARTQAERLAEWAARDAQRLAAWTDTLAANHAALQQTWLQAGDQHASRQERVVETLQRTADAIGAQAQQHSAATIAEIQRLVQAASEAPRAAAELIASLRQQLSDSLVRDNDLLAERQRILQTLDGVLAAVTHASTEQRGAIDTLVASSAALLDRVGARFAEQAQAHADSMTDAAAQVAGGAVEVASLGETFGFAVQSFATASDQLLAQLKSVEGALGKSLARSDEQLAYYVAQAREVVDLSIMSQKQIVDDLQRLARDQAPPPVADGATA